MDTIFNRFRNEYDMLHDIVIEYAEKIVVHDEDSDERHELLDEMANRFVNDAISRMTIYSHDCWEIMQELHKEGFNIFDMNHKSNQTLTEIATNGLIEWIFSEDYEVYMDARAELIEILEKEKDSM